MPKQGGKFVLSSAEESQLTTALVLLGCIEAYAVSPPAPSYSLTDIGVLPGFTATQGSSTNALGQVAGYCYTNSPNVTSPQFAFVYREGKLIDFGSLYNPDIRTIATFVNIQGEVSLSYLMPIRAGAVHECTETIRLRQRDDV
jgi:hypothetical protein